MAVSLKVSHYVHKGHCSMAHWPIPFNVNLAYSEGRLAPEDLNY